MDKIEFLVSTGVSFYSPDHDLRFSDLLLQRKWPYRVLQSASGAISLQTSSEAITNATAPGNEPLIDIGGLVVRFHDALQTCLGKWIPLPFSRKGAPSNAPSRSVDWVRGIIQRPPLRTDDNLFRLILAVDTKLNAPGSQGARGDAPGFATEDVGYPFE